MFVLLKALQVMNKKLFLHHTFFVLSFVGALRKDCGCVLWFWHVLDFLFLLDDERFHFVSVWQKTPPNTVNDQLVRTLKK